MHKAARLRKMNRLVRGEKPRVLDLFAGCGGLSLGFQAAGFEIAGAVEIDPLAAESHARNFCSRSARVPLECHARPYDITRTEPAELASELGFRDREGSFDIVVGGPPCQAFARVGRAKLREVAAHPKAFLKDPRGNLYLRYIEYVRQTQPLALLMENVPDALNHGGHNIAEEVCEVLCELGYVTSYSLLNAAHYGVPQTRTRLFLIGYAEELRRRVRFPQPTHWIRLPKGYEGSVQVALKPLKLRLFDQPSHYTEAPEPDEDLPPAVSAEEALGDLPRITAHLEGRMKRGARRMDTAVPYLPGGNPSAYATLMRTWPGFEGGDYIYDHVIRSLPRDYATFRRMKPGDQYPQAQRHALEIFAERLKEHARRGERLSPHSPEFSALRRATVPPYDPGKFPNKWRKMEANLPARTLMAHLGKDGYSHIHYDSHQARTISVREAARLQSFPDGFVFAGTMNPAFRQIGNAVPPLLAKALASEILVALGRK
jgi:DNA (cytosine-5)-methyltransferase 1